MRSGTLSSVGVFLGVCASVVCLAFQQAPLARTKIPTDFGQSRPVPPGIREGEQKINNQQTDPPREPRGRPVDSAKLKSDAAELRDLADALPASIDQVAKGVLPKDLSDNLKKIEKLAKHLRSEVNP
jgi:hypothetical protein